MQLSRSRQLLFSHYCISSSSFNNSNPGRQALKKKNSFIWQKNPVYSLSVTVADTKFKNSVYSISLALANPISNIENKKSLFSPSSSLTIQRPVISVQANMCSQKRSPILTYSDLTVYNPIYFSSLTSADASAYNSNDSSSLASARVMVYRQ